MLLTPGALTAAQQKKPFNPLYLENKIRQLSGLPSSEHAGIELGVTPGLTDEAALNGTVFELLITTEAQAAAFADSGTGTLENPYIIENTIFDGGGSYGIGFNWQDSDANYYIKLRNCRFTAYTNSFIFMKAGSKLFVENCEFYSGGVSGGPIRHMDGDLALNDLYFRGINYWFTILISGTAKNHVARNLRLDNSFEEYNHNNKIYWFNDANGEANVHVKYLDADLTGGTAATGLFSGTTDTHAVFENFRMRNFKHVVNHTTSNPSEAFTGIVLRHFDVAELTRAGILLDHADGALIEKGNMVHDAVGNSYAHVQFTYKDSTPGARVQNTVVRQLKMKKSPGNGGFCVQLLACENVTVEWCHVEECQDVAFQVQHPRSNVVQYCTVDSSPAALIKFTGNWDEDGWQTADLVADTAPSSNLIEYIFGATSHHAIVVTDTWGGDIRNIFVDNSSGVATMFLIHSSGADVTLPRNWLISGVVPNTAKQNALGLLSMSGCSNKMDAKTEGGTPVAEETQLCHILQAQTIRDIAGLQPGETAGLEAGQTAGLSGAVADGSRLALTSEAAVQALATTGTGAELDPYVIENLRLDNSENIPNTGGIYLYDLSSSYHLIIRNVEVSDYASCCIYVEGNVTVTFENCVLFDTTPALPDLVYVKGGANVTFKNTHFAGGQREFLRNYDGTVTTFENCLFDDSRAAFGTYSAFVRPIGAVSIGAELHVRHCEFRGPFWRVYHMQQNLKYRISNCLHVDVVYGVHIHSSGIDTVTDCIFENCRFEETLRNSIRLYNVNGLTIRHCEFVTENYLTNYHPIEFTYGSNNWHVQNALVENCYFKKTLATSSSAAVMQLIATKGCTVRNIHVEGTPYNAIRLVAPHTGNVIENIVSDNTGQQIIEVTGNWSIANWNYTTDPAETHDSQSQIRNIHGDSLHVPIFVLDTVGGVLENIYVSNPTTTWGTVSIQETQGQPTLPQGWIVQGDAPSSDMIGDGDYIHILAGCNNAFNAVDLDGNIIQSESEVC